MLNKIHLFLLLDEIILQSYTLIIHEQKKIISQVEYLITFCIKYLIYFQTPFYIVMLSELGIFVPKLFTF